MQLPRYPSELLFTLAMLAAVTFLFAAVLQFLDRERRGRGLAHALSGCSLTAVAILVLRPGMFVIQKLLTHLALPVGMVWLGLWLVTLACWSRGRWLTGITTLTLTAILSVAGNGTFSNWLIGRIEAPYLAMNPIKTLSDEPPLDVVVTLGGSTKPTPAGGLQVGWAGDRVLLAARIYHAGYTTQMLCTGEGDPEFHGAGRNPGREMAELLVGLGIPAESILRIGGKNTKAEFALLAEAVEDHRWQRIGLVTSAFHMPRAQRLADAVGVEIIPLPAGFLSQPSEGKPFRIIPSAEAVGNASLAFKEMLAALVAR